MRIRVSNVHGGLILGPEIAHMQVGHLWRSGAVHRIDRSAVDFRV
jgi:hypothetical protein